MFKDQKPNTATWAIRVLRLFRSFAFCFAALLMVAAVGCSDASDSGGDEIDAAVGDDASTQQDASVEDSSTQQDATPEDATSQHDAEPQPQNDPDEGGAYTLDSLEETLTRGDRDIPMVIYTPQKSNSDPSPLIVFVPGFQLDSSRYDALAQRVASHGFVFIRCDPPDPMLGVNHVAMAEDVSAVIDWALDAGSPIAGQVSSDSIGLTGHSLGGKVTTMANHNDTRVDALFGIDPVNEGNGPMGYDQDHPDILPDQLQNETLPVGFAGETVNATASGFNQACAPEGKNFIAFYEAATSASWRAQWDFIGADHMDFVDDTSGCTVCGMCEDGTADPAAVSASLHTLAVAFFRRHLLDDTAMDAWLTGSSVPGDIDVTHSP